MSYLSRQDWETLDALLGKLGFGGYYDFVEVLRSIANNLGIGNTGVEITEVKTIPAITSLLYAWSYKLSHSQGFTELAIKTSNE